MIDFWRFIGRHRTSYVVEAIWHSLCYIQSRGMCYDFIEYKPLCRTLCNPVDPKIRLADPHFWPSFTRSIDMANTVLFSPFRRSTPRLLFTRIVTPLIIRTAKMSHLATLDVCHPIYYYTNHVGRLNDYRLP